MTIRELEEIMQEYGIVLRAVPKKTFEVYEPCHKDRFPDGEIRYLESYGRDCLVVEHIPEHAGEFLIESVKGTGSTVWFQDRFFLSIEDAVAAVIGKKAASPAYKEGRMRPCGMR